MPKYFYKAKNLKGEEKEGFLEAPDISSLAKILHKKGYFLVSTGETSKGKITNISFLKKLETVSLTEKLFFTRNLKVMVETGVSLPRAINILANQAKTEKFKRILEKISEEVVSGRNLSYAVGLYPRVFSNIYKETLKIGEETGNLEDSLEILSTQMEREHNLKSEVKTAMAYPVVVLIMAVFIGIVMFIFAVPKMKDAFKQFDMPLPLTTRMIFSFSEALIHYWPAVIIAFAAIIFGLYSLVKKNKKGGKAISAIWLKVPLISKIVREINSALILRTLSSLLRAGVPIVKSLEITSGTVNNFYFKDSLKKSAKDVEKGGKLSQSLKKYKGLYLPMVVEMIEIGEETGETSKVLENLADFYEEESSATLQRLSSMIEPLLILFIGGIVGFFAISMMQPMFSIMQGIH